MNSLPRHPNQKFFYADFFRILVYFYVSGSNSLKLFIQTRLNSGLLSPSLGLRPVPYTTCLDAFGRFSPDLFQAVFRHLVTHLPFKAVPEFAALGTLCCVDGSLVLSDSVHGLGQLYIQSPGIETAFML